MDILTEPQDIIVGSEEVIISDVIDNCEEVIVEECSVEIHEDSTSIEEFIPVEEVQETVEIHETPIEFAETIIKTEIQDEELIIPAEECEVEIDQDINEFECIYIKENYLENMVRNEEVLLESDQPEDSSDEDDDDSSNEHIKCQLCNKVFQNRSSLNAHMLRHASEKYFCVICDKSFKKKHNLDFHMSMHTDEDPTYRCVVCSKILPSRDHLTSHMLVHRIGTNQERVMCNICQRSFQKSYLKVHMATHYNNTDYKCTFCAKSLSSKQSLYMHMNTVHANEGCYECSYCEKRFFWKSYLDRHITVHTKEKSHHCTYCTKAFTRKLALRKHMSTHVVKGKYCIM